MDDRRPQDAAQTPLRFDRVARGVVAGAIGGLVAGGAKLLGEAVFPPRAPGEAIPPVEAFSRITELLAGSPLLPSREFLATQLFHWPFSLAAGAVYGALAELLPIVTWGFGAVFGLVLWLATHATTLPLLGLSAPWSEIPLKEHASEILTHILFGVCLEATRRVLRMHVLSAHRGVSP